MKHVTTLLVLCVVVSGGCGQTFDSSTDTGPPPGDASTDAGAIADAVVLRDLGGAADASISDLEDMRAGEDAAMMLDMAEATACSTGSANGTCLPTGECGAGFRSVPGFCPGPADIQCCIPADDSMCVEDPPVAQMPQPNTGLAEKPGDLGCGNGMSAVADFCIDTWEAALVEVLADGATRPWSPYFNPGSRRIRAVSIEGAVPQAYINGVQAAAACAEANKRLCTDAEWLRACQGAAGNTFPYGNSRQPGVCNDARATHPAVEYFGSADNSVFSMLDNACIGQQNDTVDRTGANPGCVSDDGVLDMMGNLHEWTADSAGTFRGGYYVDTERNGPGCLYRTTAHDTPHWDYSTGFRCCADRL